MDGPRGAVHLRGSHHVGALLGADFGEDAIQRRFHGAGDDWVEKANAGLPMGKLGQPDEIADAVVFLLSERSGVVTGSVIDWDQSVPGAYD